MPAVRRVTTFRVDEELLDAMRRLQDRDGILPSEQIRRALRPWLEEKGVLSKTERTKAASRRAGTRRKA